MGVRGLTALIRRHAPETITTVPSGALEHFRGQTVIFDGTLFTQRFHYGSPSSSLTPTPTSTSNNYRSLLSWYRLTASCRNSNILPVVLFDGSTRVPEKAGELEKRKGSLVLRKWRAEEESRRFERVKEVGELVGGWKGGEEGGGEGVEGEVGRCGESGGLSKVVEELKGIIKLSPQSLWNPEDSFSPEDSPPPTPTLAPSQISERLIALYEEHARAETTRLSKTQRLLAHAEQQAFHLVASGLSSPEEISALIGLEALSESLASAYAGRAATPGREVYAASSALLESLGVPCYTIPMGTPTEAEALAATLVKAGKADVVASEDTDVLVYEAGLVRNFGVGGEAMVIDGEEVRRSLGLETREWVDLALLMGTDFGGTLPGIGVVKSLKMIKTYGSIESIIASEPKHNPPCLPTYLSTLNAARQIYLQPPVVPTGFFNMEQQKVGDPEGVLRSVGLEVPQEEREDQAWGMVEGESGAGPEGLGWDGAVHGGSAGFAS